MGREVSGSEMEEKANGERAHVAPRVSEDSFEVKECTEEEKVLGIKSINLSDNDDKLSGSRGSSDGKKTSSSPASVNGRAAKSTTTVPHPFSLATEKRASCTHASDAETTYVVQTQQNSPLAARKLYHSHSDNKKHTDEEDSWSVSSSTAASVRTNRSKVTVGHAPTFKCYARAEKRKEYYTKLEEKHQALEVEKSQCEARTKEEQEEAIKQLRKSLVIKAKPVPSFYYEAPPPKTELKKAPLTRPKSPNLNKTSRRKSCSDATKDEKERGSGVRAQRHSLGYSRETTVSSPAQRNKGPASRRASMDTNGGSRVRDRFKQDNGAAKAADISVHS